MMRLTDFKVLTFDCYGTLIDWETGMLEALKPLSAQAPAPLDRTMILEAHARHEAAQQLQTPGKPYRELLAVVCKRLAEEWGVCATWDDCLRYGQSIGDWPAFADSAAALHYLKQHYKLVILSNVDNASFARSNQKLGVDFDAVYTAEDIGSYKPSLGNFEYMLGKLSGQGIEKGAILHTAQSMFHDHKPANEIGLASCWIDRRYVDGGFGATLHPGELPHYDFRFTSLAELVAAHQMELRGA